MKLLPRSGTRRGERDLWWTCAATVLALAPLVFGFFAIAATWVPPIDDAYIALRTGDVLSAHPVLTGQRSTASFDAEGVQAHHPGPLENYLLSIPYAVSGFHAWGILLGDLLVIGVSLWVAITVCARVWRPVWALLPVTAVWIMVLIGGTRLMLRPWNPTFALVPLIALIVVAAALWRGGARAQGWLPAYVLLASLVVQAHLAFVPVVGLLTVVLAVVGLQRWHAARGVWWPVGAFNASAGGPDRSGEGARRWYSRAGFWALVVGVLAWLPPMIEQLIYSPGNVVAMWHYFTASAGSTHGSGGAQSGRVGLWGGFEVLSNLVVPSGSFVSSSIEKSGSIPASPLGVVVLAAVFGLAGRYLWAMHGGRRLRCAQQLLVVSAVLLLGCWIVLAVMSASRSLIYASTYVPITLVAVFALVGDGLDALAWRFHWHIPRLNAAARAVVVGMVVVVALALSGLKGVELNTRGTDRAEKQMIDGVAAALKAHHLGPRAVRIEPGADTEYLRERDTLAWGLDQHDIGVDMTFPGWTRPSDDDFRAHTLARPDSVRLVFVHVPVGQRMPAAPARALILWQGHMPAFGPIPAATVAIYTPSLR